MATMFAVSRKGAQIVRTTGNVNEAGQLEVLNSKGTTYMTPDVEIFQSVEAAEAAVLADLDKAYKATSKKLSSIQNVIISLGGEIPNAAEPGTDEAIDEDDEDEYEEDA